MAKYFCENLILKKEALKMAYICKKTKKICPRVKYSVNGEASPDILFTLKGCGLLKEKEEVVEQKVEKIEEVAIVVEDVIETPVVIEEKVEEVIEKVEVKVEQKTNTPKQTNYKKKKKNYNQNKNQEQK